jgi:hypothetical protein
MTMKNVSPEEMRRIRKDSARKEKERHTATLNHAMRNLTGKTDEAIANALILMADTPGSFSSVGREALLRVAGQRLRWKHEAATIEGVG